jgi:hypothetical protein
VFDVLVVLCADVLQHIHVLIAAVAESVDLGVTQMNVELDRLLPSSQLSPPGSTLAAAAVRVSTPSF